MVHRNKGKINGRSVGEKDGANERAGSEYQIRHIILLQVCLCALT